MCPPAPTPPLLIAGSNSTEMSNNSTGLREPQVIQPKRLLQEWAGKTGERWETVHEGVILVKQPFLAHPFLPGLGQAHEPPTLGFINTNCTLPCMRNRTMLYCTLMLMFILMLPVWSRLWCCSHIKHEAQLRLIGMIFIRNRVYWTN